jgi:hypothetical protein
VRSKVSAMSPSRTGRCCDVAIGDSHWPKISCLFQLTPLGCGVASSADREQASHASRARAGRSRQCQSKWAGSTRLVHQNGAGNSAVSVLGTTSPQGGHRFLGLGAGRKKQSPGASEHGSAEMLVPRDREIPQGNFSTQRAAAARQQFGDLLK